MTRPVGAEVGRYKQCCRPLHLRVAVAETRGEEVSITVSPWPGVPVLHGIRSDEGEMVRETHAICDGGCVLQATSKGIGDPVGIWAWEVAGVPVGYSCSLVFWRVG